MIKALFTSKAGSITSAAVIIGGLSMVSRLFGALRDYILAGTFGAGDTLDAYTSAFLVPDMLLQLLILGALSASFIPIFAKYYGHDDEKAWKFTNTILNVFGVVFAIVVVIAIATAPWAVAVIAPGYGVAKMAMTVQMSRVMYLAELFFAASMVFGSVLQGTRRFFLYALAPIVNNIGIIAGVIIFVPLLGPIGLAWGSVLGAAMHALLQGIGVYALGYKYRPVFNFRDPDLRTTAIQMVPRVLGLAVSQGNFVAMTSVASLLVAGSTTMLDLAYNLNSFPIGVIAMAYAVASFPMLCERAAAKDMPGFVQTFSNAVRQVLLWIIPATVLFLLLRAQLVRLAFGGKNFDWMSTVTTADTLALFAISFAAQALITILVRAFFALEDAKTPFAVAVVAALVNIGLGRMLSMQFGVVGLSAAFSVSAMVQVALLWALLHHRIGDLDEKRILRTTLMISIAALLAGAVTQGVKYAVVMVVPLKSYVSVFIQTGCAGGLGFIAYILLGIFFNNDDMVAFARGVRRKMLRQSKPVEVVNTL
ncbi:MAG: murein biosynthesis integral membrane protein MurJ [Patescibacteria group bacterium]